MNPLSIPDSSRRWDCLSLGEVMLRLEDQLMRAATTVRKGIDALPSEPGSRRKRRERE